MDELILPFMYIVLALVVGAIASHWMCRPFVGWSLLAFFFTPPITFLFLVAAGPSWDTNRDEERAQREIQRRLKAEWCASACPHCGSVLNFKTRLGFKRSPVDRPALLVCAQCEREIHADELAA